MTLLNYQDTFNFIYLQKKVMSILFTVNKKADSINTNSSQKYYARAVSSGVLEFDALVKIISNKSRISTIDCYRLLSFLEETLTEELSDGKIVRLGEMGSFQVGMSSKGAEAEHKVTEKLIYGAKVNFRSGKGFKKLLKNLVYKKVKE